jgi:membrane protease YdiL (CAAX protease family)
VPWSGIEVAIVLFMVLIASTFLAGGLLVKTAFFTWLYGPDFPLPFTPDSEKVPLMERTRWNIWIELVAFPFDVAIIPILLYLGSGTRPYQLGLTCHRLPENIALACFFWLAITPVVFAVDYLAEFGQRWLQQAPQEHPLVSLAISKPTTVELIVIWLVAVVKAPMVEELVFRGLLQRWFAARDWGGDVAIAGALALAALTGWPKAGVAPAAFVVAMIPGYIWISNAPWRWLPSWNATRAIYGTALLFAAMHSAVWPTPIPLFVLALGLGYLVHRTQSLVGPIILHALFNAVACLSFFYVSVPAPAPEKGNDTTAAVERAPSTSTSSSVPGSWEPRRTYASAMAVPSRGDTTDDVTWPTSLPSRNNLAPAGTALAPANFKPTNDRFTWP